MKIPFIQSKVQDDKTRSMTIDGLSKIQCGFQRMVKTPRTLDGDTGSY